MNTWLLALIGGLGLIILVVTMAPRFYRDGPSTHNRIIANLRQLDGAKQQWALAHGMTGNVAVTLQDISPYLEHFTGLSHPVMGERYILNRLMEQPEAELLDDFQHWRKGTRFRLSGEPVQARTVPPGS